MHTLISKPSVVRMSDPFKPTGEVIAMPLPALSAKDKRRAEAKYGKAVMAHGFTIVPNLLLQGQAHLNISPTAMNVLMQLLLHWWDANEAPHPSIKRIAQRMKKSPRSLFRYFDELEEAGLVEREARYKGQKAQTTSAYKLNGLTAKLKEIEPEMTKAKKFKDKRVEKAEAGSTAA
jgi:DNA-binding transcriptional ArsR family regulator